MQVRACINITKESWSTWTFISPIKYRNKYLLNSEYFFLYVFTHYVDFIRSSKYFALNIFYIYTRASYIFVILHFSWTNKNPRSK